jgi:hypothetical protein
MTRVFTSPAQHAVPAAPMAEEAIVLRCLSPDEAADLVRPMLQLRENSIVARAGETSRVLTVRGTPAQLQQVKSLLDQQQVAGSPACTPRPAPPVTR